MLHHQLEEVDNLLFRLMEAQAQLNNIETSLVTCSFGAWQGKASQEARQSRQQIVTHMNHAQDDLNAAQISLDNYRNTLHANALAMP